MDQVEIYAKKHIFWVESTTVAVCVCVYTQSKQRQYQPVKKGLEATTFSPRRLTLQSVQNSSRTILSLMRERRD